MPHIGEKDRKGIYMVEGLELLLNNENLAGVSELQAAIEDLLGKNVKARLVSEEKFLHSFVYRLVFETENTIKSVIVKKLTPARAQLERTVIERWLPQVGLSDHGPPLIAAAAEKTGKFIWHIYEDIGDSSLVNYMQDDRVILEAVNLIAKIHTSFADHIILGECRITGGNYNINFYSSCILEAIRTLDLVKRSAKDIRSSWVVVIDSLLQRLSQLFDMRADREKTMAAYNGIETLVHGDLWTKNFLVQHTESGIRMLLIDWDHVGVGHIYYDLSTLLLRFSHKDRPKIIEWYQEAIGCMDWQLPGANELNTLCETAEYARLANATIWPAIAAGDGQPAWAFEKLVEIDGWFNNMKPVL